MAFGRLQPRTLKTSTTPPPGVFEAVKRLPQTFRAASEHFYQTLLLTLFNSYVFISSAPQWLSVNYDRFHAWWRDPRPYFFFGYETQREVLGFVLLGILSSAFILFLYTHMLNSYRKHMANIRDMLAYYQRNTEEWDVVASNDQAIKKFSVCARELNDLMDFTRNRPKFSEEEKMQLQKEWEGVRTKINKLLRRKTGQIYDSDSESDDENGTGSCRAKSITMLKTKRGIGLGAQTT